VPVPGHRLDYKYFEDKDVFTKHELHTSIEVAGYGKDAKSVKIVGRQHVMNQKIVQLFSDDGAGVSKNGKILVIADGVGGASSSDLVTRAAIELTLELMEEEESAASREKRPLPTLKTHGQSIIELIVRFCEEFELSGSSTLTIAQVVATHIAGGHSIQIINIGDSAASIVSGDSVIFQTHIGLIASNCPYQVPSSMVKMRGTLRTTDFIKFYEVELPRGSRLVLNSDGVGDNMYNATLARFRCASELVATVLHIITGAQKDVKTPYGDKPNAVKPFKPDDVSCIIFQA